MIPNVETYCKKQECWDIISKVHYQLSDDLSEMLISPQDRTVERTAALKEQLFDNAIVNEIAIFNKGADFWASMIARGKGQAVLNNAEIIALTDAIKYCNMQYTQFSKRQLKAISGALAQLKENGIE